MNTSMRTASVARGLAIYAEFMNMPEHGPDFARCEARWDEWVMSHPRLLRIVQDTHNAIFQRLLIDDT